VRARGKEDALEVLETVVVQERARGGVDVLRGQEVRASVKVSRGTPTTTQSFVRSETKKLEDAQGTGLQEEGRVSHRR